MFSSRENDRYGPRAKLCAKPQRLEDHFCAAAPAAEIAENLSLNARDLRPRPMLQYKRPATAWAQRVVE